MSRICFSALSRWILNIVKDGDCIAFRTTYSRAAIFSIKVVSVFFVARWDCPLPSCALEGRISLTHHCKHWRQQWGSSLAEVSSAPLASPGLACRHCSGVHLAHCSFSLFLMHWVPERGRALQRLQSWVMGISCLPIYQMWAHSYGLRAGSGSLGLWISIWTWNQYVLCRVVFSP